MRNVQSFDHIIPQMSYLLPRTISDVPPLSPLEGRYFLLNFLQNKIKLLLILENGTLVIKK